MKKKKDPPIPEQRKVVKTSLSFEELMKKALNTPLPKQEKGKKSKKK
jgi:hypothetical protein